MLVCADIFASGFKVTQDFWRNTRHRFPCGIDILQLSFTVRGFWKLATNRDSRTLSHRRDNGFWILSCILSIEKINIDKKRRFLCQQTQGFREARSCLGLFRGDIVGNTNPARHSPFMT
jgi:hypothetical protein